MRQWALVLLSVAALVCRGPTAWAVPAHDPDEPARAVVLSPGERFEFAIQPNGDVVTASHGTVSADEVAGTPAVADQTEQLREAPAHAAPPTPGRLTVSLIGDAAGFRLKLVNGYGFPVGYRAFLVFERDGKRIYRATSVCPVPPGRVGVEQWRDPIVAIAVSEFHAADPNNMACSDGSLLTVSPSRSPPDRYSCAGGYTPGHIAPLVVSLLVDSGGAVQSEGATWFLGSADLAHAPGLFVDYGMMGRDVLPRPTQVRVLAILSMQPKPKATAADLVLLVNGVEKARRPWQMYSQAVSHPADPAKTPSAFFGIIPFAPDHADGGLDDLLAAFGQPNAVIEVKIVGNDGAVLADATYPVDAPPLRSKSVVDGLLDQALALAKTPTQCMKVTK